MNKILSVLLLFFLLLIGVCSLCSPVYSVDQDYDFFMKIHEVPYYSDGGPCQDPMEFWESGRGDCDDKATAFADYLYMTGRHPVLVTREFRNGQSHAFLICDGLVYDPTINPPMYAVNPLIYDGLCYAYCPSGYGDFKTEYRPDYNYVELCRLMAGNV